MAKSPVPDSKDDHDAMMEEAILAMSDAFLICRKAGHSWHQFDAQYFPEDHYYEEKWRCSSCKGVKTLYLDEQGNYFERPAYDMKLGYRTKGLGAITGQDRARFRIAGTHRFIEHKNEQRDKRKK